jgi:hypothetical protein
MFSCALPSALCALVLAGWRRGGIGLFAPVGGLARGGAPVTLPLNKLDDVSRNLAQEQPHGQVGERQAQQKSYDDHQQCHDRAHSRTSDRLNSNF